MTNEAQSHSIINMRSYYEKTIEKKEKDIDRLTKALEWILSHGPAYAHVVADKALKGEKIDN